MKKYILSILCVIIACVFVSGCSKKTRQSEENVAGYADKYIDLHLHLDGAITPDIAKKLAAVQNIELPTEDDKELEKLLTVPEDCTDLNEFLECFALPDSLMMTREGLSEAVYLVAENIKSQGVIYAEIRFAPQLHTEQGMTQEEAVLAALEGLKRTDLKVNLILCCMRGDGNEEANYETVELAKKYLVEDGGVTGIDIAGAEAIYPTSNYSELFAKAKEYGIPFTIHAGEADGAESVRCAIEYGAVRIGHGVRINEDENVVELVKNKGIYLEMCPTSNRQTHAVEDMSDYPLMDYLNDGIKVTLNTDDMAIEGTTIAEEFRYMEKNFGLTPEQEKLMLANSIDAAFTSESVKKELRKELEINSDTLSEDLGLNGETKEASQYTIDLNNEVYALLDFDDKDEFENATRGLITAPQTLDIIDENGKVIWSQTAYSFVESDSPDTANPSLWRNTQLNHIYGLFEVVDGIYQVRGYDMANITFIKGETGWIVVDPLMSVECSRAAFELVTEELGEYPVKAVIYSHSHIDHYGGVKGVISEDEVLAGNVEVIAPDGFEEHAVSENVYAGIAMGRRASYQYGTILEPGEQGSLCIGIGMGQSKGKVSYISPTLNITQTGEKHTIDGVEIEFQLTPGTEAPAEMNMWIADKKALWMAENCTGTLHNLYTLRGAQVRDGNAWAEYLMESLDLYGNEAEVVFQSHNWPHWGNDTIKEYITNTAAVYKYINDQTLLYINKGYTETEIANMIKLPEELEKVWYTRQYYGTVAHNSKAVYEKYMGWYDANPVHLAELEPSESAKKYVEYFGDINEVLKKAKVDFDNGEYQWVAEITNLLVYADPTNTDARYLCADALEQLGYQAESGPWRNAYFSAAQELRNGTNMDPDTRGSSSGDTISHMTPEMILEYMGILVDTMKVQDLSFTANIVLPDENYVLIVKNGVVMYQKNASSEEADVTWTTNKMGLLAIISKNEDEISKLIVQEGDESYLKKLSDSIETISDYNYFNIVEP